MGGGLDAVPVDESDLFGFFDGACERALARLTGGDRGRALLLFCVADCWMSWNAAQRAASLGYRDVAWFRLGVDGWLDEGRALAPVAPTPVDVE